MQPLLDDEAQALAEALLIDVYEVQICHACLSFVAYAIDTGETGEVSRALDRITPHLWAGGLALPMLAALERARREGLETAAAAIADVGKNGQYSLVVRSVVLRLATQLLARIQEDAGNAGRPDTVATVTPLMRHRRRI
jgi:hypothetical protein